VLIEREGAMNVEGDAETARDAARRTKCLLFVRLCT
jgi:hypothetical protein